MRFSNIIAISFLSVASAQNIPGIISDVVGGVTQVVGDVTSIVGDIPGVVTDIVSKATDFAGDVRSDVSKGISEGEARFSSATEDIANAFTTGTGAAATTSASASRSTSSSSNPAAYQTAAVGLGALFGGAVVMANM